MEALFSFNSGFKVTRFHTTIGLAYWMWTCLIGYDVTRHASSCIAGDQHRETAQGDRRERLAQAVRGLRYNLEYELRHASHRPKRSGLSS